MITARSLVFYIRAEDQASRVVKRVANSFGSLQNIKALQKQVGEQELRNVRAIEQAQLRIRKNEEAIAKARVAAARTSSVNNAANEAAVRQAQTIAQATRRNEESLDRQTVQASKLRRALNSPSGTMRGLTRTETQQLHQASLSSIATLNRQNELLAEQGAIAARNIPIIAAEQAALHSGALKNIENLTEQERLLGESLDEVRRKGAAASAALENEISQAKIARVNQYAASVQNLSRAIRLVGIVAIASLGFAAHAAAQFSTSVTLAATQSTVASNNTTAQVLKNSAVIQKEIFKLEASGKVTAPLGDQSSSAYQIFSSVTLLGNQAQQLQKGITLLKEFNVVASANYGLVNLNDVTKAGITLMNRFGVTVAEMPMALNRMQAAVRFGALNMQQFIAGFGQVGPAFNAARYSFNQMAATMAFVSRKFSANIPMGFTGLARLTEALANPKMLEGFKAVGIAVTDTTGHLLPLDKIIGNIIQRFPKLVKGGVDLQNFFKNIGGLQSTAQARRVFVSIAQDLPGYRDMLHKVVNDNNELTKSWEAMQKSPQVQWVEFENKLKAVVYQIGIYAIPAIASMGQYIARLVEWFDKLSPHTKKVIALIATFGSVAAILGSTLLIVVAAAVKFYNTIKLLQLAKLAGEAGFARVQLLGVLAALVVIVPLLHHFHVNILEAITGTHGFSAALKILSIVLAGLAIRAIIASLIALIPALSGVVIGLGALTFGATAATVSLGTLAAASAATVAAVAVLGYGLSRALDAIPGVTPALKHFGSMLYDTFNDNTNSHIAVTASNLKQVREELEKSGGSNRKLDLNRGAYLQDIDKITKMYKVAQGRMGTTDVAVPDNVLEARLAKLFPELTENTIKIFVGRASRVYADEVKRMQAGQFTQALRLSNFITPLPHNTFMDSGTMTEKEFLAGITRIHKLQEAYEKAPNLAAASAAWKKYHSALDLFTKSSTEAQKKMITDLLGSNIFPEIEKISDQAVLVLARNADKLRKTQEKAPSITNYDAWQKAVLKLTSTATQKQQEMAASIIENTPVVEIQTITDRAAIALARTADNMRKVFEKAPNDANWRKWEAARKALTKSATTSQEEMANAVVEATPAVMMSDEQVMKRFKVLEKLKKALGDHPSLRGWESYYKQLDKFNENSTQAQQQAVSAMLQSVDDNVKKIKDKLQSATGTLRSMYDDLLSQNQALFGDLFQGPVVNSPRMKVLESFGGTLTGTDLLSDLQTQLLQYKNINKTFDTLSSRGAPKTFIDQLRAMGPAGKDNIEALKKLSPGDFKSLISAWSRAQAAIKRNTEKQLEGQLKIYESFGKRVALAILTGIRSQDVALEKTLKNTILNIFPELGKVNKAVNETTVNKDFTLSGTNTGLLKPGNLDLLHRQIATIGNSIATVRSITVGIGKNFVLLPTIIKGVARTNQYAIDYYRKTGQNLGVFNTETNANKYAVKLHLQQEKLYKDTKPTVVHHHTHYEVKTTAPAHDVKTQIKHADFTARNKYKGRD